MLGLQRFSPVRLVVAACLFAAPVAGCSSAARPAPVQHAVADPEVVLSPEGAAPVTVTVEVARTPSELEKGLMYRTRLEGDRGMLFLLARREKQTFWMHNTYISLDMIFIDTDHKVVGIVEKAEPLTDTPRSVPEISQYVLEVAGGWAASHRIAPGTLVKFNHVDPIASP